MLRSIVLVFTLYVSLFFFTSVASADEEKKIQDCKFWSTKMVMSESSGAVGHVISGDFKDDYCKYNIRFALGGRLVIVEDLRDYELVWAPKAEKSTKTGTADNATSNEPTDLLQGLDFGGN